MKNIFAWAALLVLLFLQPVIAQITAPEPTGFKIKQFTWSNETGTLLNEVTLQSNRLDTLDDVSLRIMAVDTVKDSLGLIIDVTSRKGIYTPVPERDTVMIHEQIALPKKTTAGNIAQVKSGLFLVRFNNQSPKFTDDMRISLNPISPDQGYMAKIVFAHDSIFGTRTDTSAAIYLGRGVKSAVFGFRAAFGTPEVLYKAIFNVGAGWGPANPLDSLAIKTWTDDATAGIWQFRKCGELLEADYLKIIRTGEAAADTGRTEELIRLIPR